tara:strand:+ start:188 stop:631 length:444 start_codon:yes stop_codon:yes gene_type:complete
MWLPIDDVYSISIDGQVKRYGKLMKGGPDGKGYRRVCQYGKYIRIHRLVASRFLPQPTSDECEIDHIDRNKSNNHASNLRWCSRSDNNLNKEYKLGNTGEKHIRHDIRCKKTPWNVRIQRYNKSVFDGRFKTIQEAITARDNFINSM